METLQLENIKPHKASSITKEKLDRMHVMYYGKGKKVKVGDKVVSGFVMRNSNWNNNISMLTLVLKMFVQDDEDGMLYELY